MIILISTLKVNHPKFLHKNICNKSTPVKELYPIKQYKDLDNELIKTLIFNENINKSGIYRWKYLINGKTYLGSFINLSKIFNKYFHDNALNKNNMLINKAIIRHGHGNFALEVLEYYLEKDVIKREQYYLYLLTPEYNILKIACSSYDYKHSKATLMKLKRRAITKNTLNKMMTLFNHKIHILKLVKH